MGVIKTLCYNLSYHKFIKYFKNETIFPYYHLVSDDEITHVKHLYKYKNRNQFIEDIDFLVKNYTPLSPLHLLQKKIPANSFLLSFDDGLQEVYTEIYPLLKERNLTAIFFINPDYIDNKEVMYKHGLSILTERLKSLSLQDPLILQATKKTDLNFTSIQNLIEQINQISYVERQRIKELLSFFEIDIDIYLKNKNPYLTKKQIETMIADGFYFGGHTMSHPPLHTLSHSEQKQEIIESIEWLKFNFNLPYSLFAFPFTDKNISKTLIHELFQYDENLLLFGNAGLKRDIDDRIIQRFSLEKPDKIGSRLIIAENLYKNYNKLIGSYNIRRR